MEGSEEGGLLGVGLLEGEVLMVVLREELLLCLELTL